MARIGPGECSMKRIYRMYRRLMIWLFGYKAGGGHTTGLFDPIPKVTITPAPRSIKVGEYIHIYQTKPRDPSKPTLMIRKGDK